MKYPISNFTQILPVGYLLVQADRRTEKQTEGRTGRKRLVGAVRDYSNAPESALLWDVQPHIVVDSNLHFFDTTSRVGDLFLCFRRKQLSPPKCWHLQI